MLEDGVPLGAPHRLHAALADGSRGWSHWGDTLYFAPGDRSDPRANGRRYEVVLVSSPRVAWLWLALVALACPAATNVAANAGVRRALASADVRGMLFHLAIAVAAMATGVAFLRPIVESPASSALRWWIAGGLALAGLPARSSSRRPAAPATVPSGPTLSLRTIAAILAFFAATATINAPDRVLAGAGSAAMIEALAPWACAALLVAAWFRPSLAALLLAIMAWKRVAAVELTGFPNVSADWLPVAAVASVLLVGVVVQAWLGRRVPTIFVHLLPLAAALQLGNYVASAWEKIRISPTWTEWLLHNRTETLVRVSDALGVWSPASALGLAEGTHDTIAATRVLVNATTLAIEFLPLVAVFRLRWMVAALLLGAALHLGIFFATGLLFWKWIGLDLALAAGLWRMRDAWSKGADEAVIRAETAREVDARPRATSGSSWPKRFIPGAAALATILLQPLFMETVRLGWFDTAALNRVRFEAILADGSVVAVPSTFFASGSYRVACGVFPPAGSAFFPTDTWATTDEWSVKQASDDGTLATHPPSTFEASCSAADIDTVLRRHHEWALSRSGVDGRPRIGVVPGAPFAAIANFWPHHIIADPRRSPRFGEIDLREVVAYRVVAEAVRLERGPEGRGFAPRVVLRDVHETPIAP